MEEWWALCGCKSNFMIFPTVAKIWSLSSIFSISYITLTRNVQNSKCFPMIPFNIYSPAHREVVLSLKGNASNWFLVSAWPSGYPSFFLVLTVSWISTLLLLLPPSQVVLLEPITFLQQSVTRARVISVSHSQGLSDWFRKGHKIYTRPVWVISGF